MKIVIAGGTGFVGKALVGRLVDEGHKLVVLSRNADALRSIPSPNLKIDSWDGRTLGRWVAQLEYADAVVNLAGEGIADKRWTKTRKQALISSRLDSTRVLVSAIARTREGPKTLVNASAVGFYGDVKEGDVKETSPQGKGFLPELCAAWEAEAKKAESAGVRVVMLRIGIVLEKEGGALQKFIPPFRLFVGGPLGSGRQYFPWVHREDVIGAIIHVLQNSAVSGPVNVTAPGVLTMKGFCSTLGNVLGRPSWAPVPPFVLKLLLGEMAGMLVTGQKAIPQRLLESGYCFRFDRAEEALQNILRK